MTAATASPTRNGSWVPHMRLTADIGNSWDIQVRRSTFSQHFLIIYTIFFNYGKSCSFTEMRITFHLMFVYTQSAAHTISVQSDPL
jgi:hypothetical protein